MTPHVLNTKQSPLFLGAWLILLCLSACANPSPPPLASYQRQFIETLVPTIQQANQAVIAQRQTLMTDYARWQAQQALSPQTQQRLKQLAKQYDVDSPAFQPAWWQRLQKRIDKIPASLIIAQAINESNWGRSRFARVGHNYFGIWCYQPGCGLVPKQRAVGQRQEVRRFDSMLASVKGYLHNLNVSSHYQALRDQRFQLRRLGLPLTGLALVSGLKHYSARGIAYVHWITQNIQRYQLQRFDQPRS